LRRRAHAGIALWPNGEQALANCQRLIDMARHFERGAFLHDVTQIADRLIRREIAFDDRGHDDVGPCDRSWHRQDAHTTHHGVKIDDIRQLRLVADERVAIRLGLAAKMKSLIRSSRRARSCARPPITDSASPEIADR
jgi:hypothetical protein